MSIGDAFLWAKNDAPVVDVEEWAILMAYSERGNDDGTDCWQSHPTIAARARVSTKTVQRRVKAFLERGIFKLGDQSVVDRLPRDERPIVYDMQIPYSWFPNIERINDERRLMGKPPITPEMRPDLPPAPPMKKRADAGTSRPKNAVDEADSSTGERLSGDNGWTTSPGGAGLLVHPLESDETDIRTGLQVRVDYKSRGDRTTSPPTLGVLDVSAREDLSAPSRENLKQEEPSPSQNLDDQETEAFVKSDAHWPDLTDAEAALVQECLSARSSGQWTSRLLRKVVGSRTIREISRRDPDLVRRAFLLAAGHRETFSPMRLWHVELCQHWAQAERELSVERGSGAEAEAAPEATAQQLRPVPAPARLQESTTGEDVTYDSREAAKADAAARIAASRIRMKAAAPPPVSHAERMAELDRRIAEVGVGSAS